MASHRPKRKKLHTAAKEIICRVIDVCDEEARTGILRIDLAKRQNRISDYTAVSIRTVSRIMDECRKAGVSKLSTPGKTRRYQMSKLVYLDYFGIHVIRNVINDFYLCDKGNLTAGKLLAAVKEKIDFPGGLHALRTLLNDMGFKWKKCRKSRYRLLVENPYFTLWRFRYLKSIRKAREENKNIVYVSETWVDKNLTLKKCWYSGDSICTRECINHSNRLIILHACKETGFVQNAQLIFKSNEATEDYDGHMSYKKYGHWLIEKVLPNIPENCIIVLDNSPNNCAEQNKIPGKFTTKAAMISWLEKNRVSVSSNMNKGEIYNLIAKYKNKEKVYWIDEMLKAEGHTVLRLPPYMFDLNPLELVWEKVESKLRHKNLKTHPPDPKMPVIEAINSITSEDWLRIYSDIIKIENEYSRNDEAMEVEMDKFLENLLHPESSESTSESESEVT